MRYTEFQHRHRFAVWSAARAAQRGFTRIGTLRDALEQSGVMEFAREPRHLSQFDELHKVWCASIIEYLELQGVSNVSYGRAAKLTNVYLKSMVVLNDISSKAAHVTHPPVDRILLRNIAKMPGLDRDMRGLLKTTNWTQLNENEYFGLIEILKKINGENPFWMIEQYWTVTDQLHAD